MSDKNERNRLITIVREWLGKNKIFFEVFAAIILSSMGVLVSTFQWISSTRQTELLKLQTTVLRQQAMPHLVVRAVQLQDARSGEYAEEKIFISNEGTGLQAFRCTGAVFFDLTLSYAKRPDTEKTIAVNGYLPNYNHTGQSTGELVTITGPKNNARFGALLRNLQQLAKKQNAFAYIEIRRYVRVGYRDVFGNGHVDYFKAPMIYGGHLLPREEGKRIFTEHRDSMGTSAFKDFSSLTAEDLLKHCTDPANGGPP